MDATRVTQMLQRAEYESVVGRVTTLAVNELGAIIREALAFSVQLAEFKEQDVDDVDPENQWTPDLGLLE